MLWEAASAGDPNGSKTGSRLTPFGSYPKSMRRETSPLRSSTLIAMGNPHIVEFSGARTLPAKVRPEERDQPGGFWPNLNGPKQDMCHR